MGTGSKHVKKQRKRWDGCWSGQSRARVFLPYIKGISEKIGTACKPLCTYRQSSVPGIPSGNPLRNVKGRLGLIDVKGVVYSLPVLNVQQPMLERLGGRWVCMPEQRRVVKNTDHKNGIAMSKTHTINWQEANILEWEENYVRRVLEDLVIQQKRPKMKLDGGLI